MMYQEFEIPVFSAQMCYLDRAYLPQTMKEIIRTLEKYGFYPGKLVNAGKSTRNRYLKYNEKRANEFLEAYSNPQNFFVGLSDASDHEAKQYWHFYITLLKHPKNVKLNGLNTPWNVLYLNATYDKFKDVEFYNRYFACFKELIRQLDPFYACMDDMALIAKLGGVMKYGAFPCACWWNYMGADYKKLYLLPDVCSKFPVILEVFGNGIMFQLTESLLDLASDECIRKRLAITHLLNLKNLPVDVESIIRKTGQMLG